MEHNPSTGPITTHQVLGAAYALPADEALARCELLVGKKIYRLLGTSAEQAKACFMVESSSTDISINQRCGGVWIIMRMSCSELVRRQVLEDFSLRLEVAPAGGHPITATVLFVIGSLTFVAEAFGQMHDLFKALDAERMAEDLEQLEEDEGSLLPRLRVMCEELGELTGPGTALVVGLPQRGTCLAPVMIPIPNDV